jgi:hypothetical protein
MHSAKKLEFSRDTHNLILAACFCRSPKYTNIIAPVTAVMRAIMMVNHVYRMFVICSLILPS